MIEGDNYHALEILNYTHKEKIDVIYIDPPYNKGKDFKYGDKWIDKEDGYRHSYWLSFMQKRLLLARDLLTKEGVIFINIDDNEMANLKLLCDSIFHESNFVALLPRIVKKSGKSTDNIAKNHDYVLVYFRSALGRLHKLPHTDDGFKYKDEYFKERGYYKLNQTLDYDSLQYSASLDYEIEIENEILIAGGVSSSAMRKRQTLNPERDFCWRWSRKRYDFGLKNGFVVLKKYKNKLSRIYTKTYQNATIETDDNGEYFVDILPREKAISSLDFIDNVYSNDNAKKELRNIFGKIDFDYPKPSELIKKLFKISTNKSSIILDCFAGTGTSGHALLDLNKEDSGKRTFILCTNNENNICEDICYNRLKTVSEGYSFGTGKKPIVKKPTNSNLEYLKIQTLAHDDKKHSELDIKEFMVDKCTEIIKVKERCFDLQPINDFLLRFNKEGQDVYVLQNIYDMTPKDYDEARKAIDNATGPIVTMYILALQNQNHYKRKFKDVNKQIIFEPLPENFLKILRKIQRKKR